MAGLLMACNSRSRGQAAKDKVTDAIEDVRTATARDISGTYTGTLPTASGSGMEVTIVLGKDTFKKSYFYVEEKGKPYESSGKFVWNPTNTIITLQGEEAPNQYFVGSGQLIQLDTEGNRITGNLADNYILRKK